LFILCASVSAFLDTFPSKYSCFDRDKQTVLKYSNTQRIIPEEDLPVLTISSGGWDTNTIANILYAIIFKEKVGINVRFYPPLESLEEMTWEDYENDTYHPKYNEGGTFDDDYADWVRSGRCDFFALADIQGGIVQTTFSKFIEQPGWYVPSYVFAKFPTCGENSTQNMTAWWSEFLYNKAFAEAADYAILASQEGYVASRRSKKVLELRGLDDMGWNIKFTNNTDNLTAIVNEKYENGETFVFKYYNPAPIDYRNFERIRFPDSQSGYDDDPCLDDGICDFVGLHYYTQISVSWMQRLGGEYTSEITELLEDIDLPRNNISSILRNYTRSKNVYQSVCSYLKERYNEKFWQNHKPGDIFEYEERDLPYHVIFRNVIAASIYIIFVLIFMACFHYFHQSFELFARLPYGWTLLWFSGFILLAIFIILENQQPTATTCSLIAFINNISLTLLIIPPLTQAYRVYFIFQPILQLHELTNKTICMYLSPIFLIEIALSTWKSAAFLTDGVGTIYDDGNHSKQHSCRVGHSHDFITVLEFSSKFLWCALLVYYGIKTKHAWEEYRESEWYIFVAGMVVVSVVLNGLLYVLGVDPLAWRRENILAGWVLCVLLPAIFFYRMWRHRDDENQAIEKQGGMSSGDKVKMVVKKMEPAELKDLMEYLQGTYWLKKDSDHSVPLATKISMLVKHSTERWKNNRSSTLQHMDITSLANIPSNFSEEASVLRSEDPSVPSYDGSNLPPAPLPPIDIEMVPMSGSSASRREDLIIEPSGSDPLAAYNKQEIREGGELNRESSGFIKSARKSVNVKPVSSVHQML